MLPYDLSSATEKLYARRGAGKGPRALRPLSQDTPILFLHSETDSWLSNERRGPDERRAREESNSALSSSSSFAAAAAAGGLSSGDTPDESSNGDAGESSPGCESNHRRDTCLLRCDPWAGSIVALAVERHRLTLRTAVVTEWSSSSPFRSCASERRGGGYAGRGGPQLHADIAFHDNRASHASGGSGTRRVAINVDTSESDREDGEEEEEEEEGEREALPFHKVFSTRWSLHGSHASGLPLAAASDTGLDVPAANLFRVDWASNGGGGGGETGVVALSAQQLFLVDVPALASSAGVSRDSGGPVMGIANGVTFDQPLSVSATAMDAYGAHCTLVGFSNGQLCVYDWRERQRWAATERGHPPPALTLAAVPQPLWLLPRGTAAARRRRLGLETPTADGVAATSAGVVACCTLEDSWRVVCGLSDARGTVVVSDLRKATCNCRLDDATDSASPVTAATQSFYGAAVSPLVRRAFTRKRSRLTPTEAAVRDLLNGRTTTVTGRTITAMRHCRERFGLIGMVDSHGDPVLTSIAALESGDGPPNGEQDGRRGGLPPNEGGGEGGGAFAGPRRAGGTPALPTPLEVLQRIRSGQRDLRAPMGGSGGNAAATATRLSLDNRCCFANDGRHFVYTRREGDSGVSAASFLSTGLGARPMAASSSPLGEDGQVLSLKSRGGSSGVYSIAALSALGNAVCLETHSGHSICVLLDS